MNGRDKALGAFLRDRRARLDPAAFGFARERRRTPGLRREEVAQLAHVSITWYTWLEQGRGGAPSAEVVERIARALALTGAEREHLFLLAQDRPPRVGAAVRAPVSAQLQRVLDALGDTPAVVKTPDWTVVAWNRAATVVLGDFPRFAERDRNVMRRLFGPEGRARLRDWESVARLIVANVRRDTARTGTAPETEALIEELSRESAAFRTFWAEQEVNVHGEGVKELHHPLAGLLKLEYSTFAVEGRPDLALVIFNPATDADRAKLSGLVAAALSPA